MDKIDQRSAHALHEALIESRRPSRVEDCADHTGYDAATLYKQADGRRPIYCPQIKRLVRWARERIGAKQAIRLFVGLAGSDDLGLVVTEAASPGESQDSILLRALGLGHLTGSIQDMIARHLSDGRYTATEGLEASELIDECIRALVSLRLRIRRAAGVE